MIVDELIALLGFDFKGGNDLQKFKNGINEGERAAKGFVGSLGKMAMAAGAAFAAIGGLTIGAGIFKDAVQEAMDFESALTEIQKKAGATADQMRGVRSEILDLGASGKIASSYEEIAAAYERAAAGGLPINELQDFALLSAKAADAFGGMSSESVANAFLGFNTIFKTPIKDLERVADLINTLADSGIADESGVIDFMDRVGATMKTAGFSIEQTAALGTAMQNLKIPAEVAATAMKTVSSILLSPSTLSKEGRGAFKALMGDATSFSKVMQKDGSKGLDMVLDRLSKLDVSKRTALATTIFGRDHIGTILTMVEGLEEVRRNQKLAADEQAFLGSLGKSYALKLDDANQQIGIMQNRFKRVRLEIGEKILPVLGRAVTRAGEIVNRFYESGGAARFGNSMARGLDLTLTAADRAVVGVLRVGQAFLDAGNGVVDFTSKVTGLDRSLSAVAIGAGALAFTGFGRGILKFAANRAPIAAAAVIVEDLFRAFNGEDSYIGSLEGAQGIISQIKADATEAGVAFDQLASSLNDVFGIEVASGETPLDALTRSATALMNTEILGFLRDMAAAIKEVTGFASQLTSEVDFQKAVEAGREKQGKGFLARNGIGETTESTLESARAGGWQGAAPAPVSSPVTLGESTAPGVWEKITGWFSSSEENNAATQAKLDNLAANMSATGQAPTSVQSTITNQDQRQFPVTNNVSAPVTVNVQQATQAPAAVGAAVSNTMRTAAVPPARIAGGTDAP